LTNIKVTNTLSAKDQSMINKSIILNYLMENYSVSRANIAANLKISPPTVSRIIDELISEGFVLELGKHLSTGGKKAIKLGFNDKSGSVIGVDLGKDRIRIARSDMGGNILEKHVGFKIYYKDKQLLDKVINELKLFIDSIESNGSGDIKLKGICIGIPANIDAKKGVVLSSPLFVDWHDLNLKEIFSEHFEVNVFVENSKNMSVIGEKYIGGEKKYRNFVMLEVGEGVGAGIVIDNQLYRGSSFSAGEVGFIVESAKQLFSTYKIKGAMENIVSPNVLKSEIIKVIEKGKDTSVKDMVGEDLDAITPQMVCKASIDGDKASIDIINNVVENLSIICLNLTLILNPEVIVVGGDILELPEVEKLFLKPIVKIIKKVVPFRPPVIKTASLGIDAGILGCTAFAKSKVLGNLYPYKI